MRKITFPAIAFFVPPGLCIIVLAFCSSWALLSPVPLGGFREIAVVFSTVVIFYVYLIIAYRLFLKFLPLRAGKIEPGSRDEFIFFIYLMFFLFGFHLLIRNNILPVPVMRELYVGMGAKIGKNSYPSGILTDPIFIKIGKNTLIGQHALVVPHVIENDRLAHYPIEIGDNVTIGALSMIMAGTKIGNSSIIGSGSIVTKGTVIGDNEIWGGVPAKLIKKREAVE